jgi:uncharacterized repeat protein (TIGR02059 family)
VGDVIPISVKFNERVDVTGTPSLTLETGIVDQTAGYVSGSGSDTLTFNYTVQTGDNSSDLAYTASNALSLNSGTIKDAAGNVAILTLPEPTLTNSLKANKSLVVDGILPTILSSKGYTGSQNIILNTTETVNGSSISANDFVVVMNSSQTSVTGVAVSGTSVTLTLADNIPNSATLSIKYTQSTNTITDTAGNALASIGDPLAVTVTTDSTVPTVQSVSSTADNTTYKVGDVIPITVTFTEKVFVNTDAGIPSLTLETGIVDQPAGYESGSGSNTLKFNYTVQTGDKSSDLVYIASNPLLLNNASIKDAAGNVANLVLPSPGQPQSLNANKGLIIDGIVPTVETQTADAGTKIITLTMSEALASSNPKASDFAVLINNVDKKIDSVDVKGTTAKLTLADYIPNSAAVTVDYTQGTQKITDTAGNALASIGNPLNVSVTDDSIVPTVQSVSSTADNKTYKVGDVIPITVKFSESVFVTGTPLLALETGDTDRTVNYASGTGAEILTFNYTVQSGDNSADLAYTTSNALSLNSGTIKDAAGNVATLTLPEPSALTNSLKANKNLVVDGILPVFSTQTAIAGTKTITLTTSETVSSTLIASDFAVSINNVSSTVSSVALNGTTVTLTLADYIPNSAAVTVDYTQGTQKITDTAGNALASIGNPLNVSLTDDSTVPTVQSVSSTPANKTYKVGDVVPITVTFSEPVVVTKAANNSPLLTLKTGNLDRTATFDKISESDNKTLVFNYTVQSGDSSSPLNYATTNSLTLSAGVTIKDAAGNNATLTLPKLDAIQSLGVSNLKIDGVVPTVATLAAAAGTKIITLTMSEALASSNPNASDFAVLINNVDKKIDSVFLSTDVNGTTAKLTLADYIPNSAAVTVDYTQGTNKITDVAGNALASIGNPLNVSVTDDSIVPTVQSVSSTADNKTYKVGDVVPITVKFSEPVFVTKAAGSSPLLRLETGNVDQNASYASGSGTDTLTFNYTVQSGDSSSPLNYVATSSLTLPTGVTIRDTASNDATLTLPATTNNGLSINNLRVDGILPAFLNASEQTSPFNDGTLTKNGTFPLINLDFNEAVNIIDKVELNKNIGISTPLGIGDKKINFIAYITDGNLIINLDETDLDISSPHNQRINIDILPNTLQDIAGNVLPQIIGVNSYSILLNI